MPRYESSSSVVRVVSGVAAPALDWELLYDVHAARLRRVIQRKVGSALVEDVLQETFLRAFKSRHTIDPTRPIAPWLITIALRTAADTHRSQLRSVESVAIEDEQSPDLALDSLEEELLNRARRLGIKHAFASLNTRQRRLLELVAVDGMTYDSVADHEDMTPDAVKSALARARTNFRTSFAAATGESGPFAIGVGGWLLRRLRSKARRSALFVGHHAAGFGAATLSVAVVAVGAIPAVRPLQGQAAQMQATAAGAVLSDGRGLLVPAPTATPPLSQGGPAEVATDAAKPPVAKVRTNASVAYDGERFTAQVRGDAEAGDNHTWTATFITIDCTANPTTATQCGVLEQLPVPPDL